MSLQILKQLTADSVDFMTQQESKQIRGTLYSPIATSDVFASGAESWWETPTHTSAPHAEGALLWKPLP